MKAKNNGINNNPTAILRLKIRYDETPIDDNLSGVWDYLLKGIWLYPFEYLRKSNASIKGSLWFTINNPINDNCIGAII